MSQTEGAKIAIEAMRLSSAFQRFEELIDEYEGKPLTTYRQGRLKLRLKFLHRLTYSILETIKAGEL